MPLESCPTPGRIFPGAANVGGFSDAVFGVVAALLADDGGRVAAEVEKVEL